MSGEFDIEELLKTHLRDEKEVPPVGLFEAIDAQIIGEKKRKKRFFWWFWFGFGSCSVIALLLIGRIFLNTHQLEVQLSKEYFRSNHIVVSSISAIPRQNSNANKTDASTQRTARDSSHGTNEQNILQLSNSKINSNTGDQSGRANTSIKQGPKKQNKNSGTSADMHAPQSTKTDVKSKTDLNKQKTELKDNEWITGDYAKSEEPLASDSLISKNNSDTLVLAEAVDSSFIANQIEPCNDSIIDSIKQIPPRVEQKESKYGLLIYGGPTLFDIAVFKPYFSSGALSKTSFTSSGYEIGFGFYRQIKQRFVLQVFANYSALKSQFTYDLMISEEDFFYLYESGTPIPLENLDNPESCNCFLAEDAALSYKISNFSFNLGSSYQIIQRPKFILGPALAFTGVLSTKFINKASNTVSFPINLSEKFMSYRLEFGLGFYYKFTDHLQLGFTPSYGIQFNTKSSVYAKNLNRILLPLSLKFAF